MLDTWVNLWTVDDIVPQLCHIPRRHRHLTRTHRDMGLIDRLGLIDPLDLIYRLGLIGMLKLPETKLWFYAHLWGQRR